MPRKVAPPPAPARNPQPLAQASVVAPTAPPTDATAQCKDGTYLFGTLPAQPCADHGGLAARLPTKPPPPKKPPQR